MVPDTPRALAEFHLADTVPRRWEHVQGVGTRAESLGDHLDDGAVLTAAAWLHDIGYAPSLAALRFHPLDGARAIRGLGADSRVCDLVAFHSAAEHEADALGLRDALVAEFADETSVVRDLLWYLDMTTSPDGETIAFAARMSEVRDRYPDDHYVVRALDKSMDDRRAAVERAQTWLASAGVAGHV